MKKIIIVLFPLIIALSLIIYLGCERGSIEEYYALPQAKSYVNASGRKMTFEIYSNNDKSLIKYPNKNIYTIKFNDSFYTLNNVNVDILKQDEMYVYVIESDVIDTACELLSNDNTILEITNSKYKMSFNIGNLSILTPQNYKLLSIDDLYGSYSYVNGSLELVGININFSNKHTTLQNINIGGYAIGDLANTLDYLQANEINILELIPSYNILKINKLDNLKLNDTSYFIPINYPRLLSITQGFILFEIDNESYYLDTFSFIVNKLEYKDYKNKLKVIEVVYDKNK